ncbi:hypothetical protein CZ809_02061 [Photobacterium piscicola]|uniref:Uncharacterized protein n=1 Tax=Photobacterium piscicola TaxID=1378299 RepID=A0A1T5I0N7_9GAMM|nr:hypothetical protein [Photobacterium piscicola]SKC32545.1 hypothetical protein CZ809_02061 [Photobacterium piscicola]
MNFKIKAARSEDIMQAFVWVTNTSGFDKFQIVKIKNLSNKKIIWVTLLHADQSFIKNYNNKEIRNTISITSDEQCLIISEWYRDLLEIEKNKIHKLDIKQYSIGCIKSLLMSKYHPDTTVRLSATLGLFSIVLGIIGISQPISDLIVNFDLFRIKEVMDCLIQKTFNKLY